jgi:hypothetical protein
MADPIRLTREELYDRVWSEPVSALAKRFGLSDVGLKKICKRHDIPTPGLGYWAKLAHGKHVTRDRLPANTDRSRSTIVIQGHTDSLSSSNRRDTLALIEREKIPEYRVASGPPGALRHPLTIATERVLKKTKEAGWITPPHGCLALRVSKEMLPRALSIIDAVLVACEERGWGVVAAYPTPRRSMVGTFWYPGMSWVSQMRAEPSPATLQLRSTSTLNRIGSLSTSFAHV